MSRKCIYSDGKGNTVVMPARKTYFKQLTTTTQETTSIILRDPPPVTPSEIRTVELTTIGIAGAAIIAFSLLAIILAVVINRRRKSIREPDNIVDNIDHIYDEIGKQKHAKGCFPLSVKKKRDKTKPLQKLPSIRPRRTAGTNIYDYVEGFGQCKPKEKRQAAANLGEPIELNEIHEKSPNTYFELENENATKNNVNPYFELENDNVAGVERKDKIHPIITQTYFQLEEETTTNPEVPNPYFELEDEMGDARDPSRRHCSCGNRQNVRDQYVRADLYRPNSLPRMHHDIFNQNRRTVDPHVVYDNADVSWDDRGRDRIGHMTPYSLASVDSDIQDRLNKPTDKNQYFVLDKDAHDTVTDNNQLVHTVNKEITRPSTSFPVETDAVKIAGRHDFNMGEYSHLQRHPEWDSTKPLSRLVSVDQLERLNGEGGVTVIILPPTPDIDSTESAHYDRIHFSPIIKPRSRLNSAPH